MPECLTAMAVPVLWPSARPCTVPAGQRSTRQSEPSLRSVTRGQCSLACTRFAVQVSMHTVFQGPSHQGFRELPAHYGSRHRLLLADCHHVHSPLICFGAGHSCGNGGSSSVFSSKNTASGDSRTTGCQRADGRSAAARQAARDASHPVIAAPAGPGGSSAGPGCR